jgi:serine protease Do
MRLFPIVVLLGLLGWGCWSQRPLTALVTPEENNTVRVASVALNSVVTVEATLDPNSVGFGESNLETGTGFFVAAGFILTNAHVVDASQRIEVIKRDGTVLTANLVAEDRGMDLALLEVTDTSTPILEFASEFEMGQKIIVLGAPYSYRNSISTGLISGTSFVKQTSFDDLATDIASYILTDALVLPGHSGGPALDSSGRVLGVVSGASQDLQGGTGLGLIIPGVLTKRIVQDMLRDGESKRGSLLASLLSVADLSPLSVTAIGLKEAKGVLLLDVLPEGAADLAGLVPSEVDVDGQILQLGDVILAMNGTIIQAQSDFLALLEPLRAGQVIKLLVWRDQETIEIRLKLQKPLQTNI